MSTDDALWHGNASQDAELQRLEQLLGRFALRPGLRPRTLPRPSPARRAHLAIAAALLLGLVSAGAWWQHRLHWPTGAAWPVVAQGGEVRFDGRPGRALAPGQTLSTGVDGWARLQVARIGELAVAPGSQLRVEETRSGRHRVHLAQGRLWARVWAPPQQFGVAIPGAELWDLGCEFSLESDADGTGLLRVTSGWVLLQRGDTEVLVPQGTQVAMRDGEAVGTPHASDAGADFIALLDALDRLPAAIASDDPALARLAALARPADAISLLSLMQRHPPLADSPLFDRFLGLVPAARGLSREALRGGDTKAFNRAWDALPYPRAKRWWWHWRDALPGPAAPLRPQDG